MYWKLSYYKHKTYNHTILSLNSKKSKTTYIKRKYLEEAMIHSNCELYNASTINALILDKLTKQIEREKGYDRQVN